MEHSALQIFRALSFTVWQAFLSMLIALGIGLCASYYAAKKKSLFARFLSSLSAVPLCVPPLLVALGFVLFYGMNGTANRFLVSVFSLKESPLSFLYSFTGIIIAHGFYNFPLVMRTCADVWESLPEEEEQAAALLGASKWRVFRTITLYQLSSSIASSCILVFLYCFFSFIIVLLFGSVGGTTIEVEVYRAARIT
ncbi:MAG TPA: ABC transporter permease subunit, partial [Treponemataceae bacterium]|nr:ABC transporter permease subunit [Treponemataceae bacterium]